MESSKKPFILLREAFALRGDTDEKVKAQALGAWSMVHGYTMLLTTGQLKEAAISLMQIEKLARSVAIHLIDGLAEH